MIVYLYIYIHIHLYNKYMHLNLNIYALLFELFGVSTTGGFLMIWGIFMLLVPTSFCSRFNLVHSFCIV